MLEIGTLHIVKVTVCSFKIDLHVTYEAQLYIPLTFIPIPTPPTLNYNYHHPMPATAGKKSMHLAEEFCTNDQGKIARLAITCIIVAMFPAESVAVHVLLV